MVLHCSSEEQAIHQVAQKERLGMVDAIPDYVFPEPTKNESGRRRFCIFSQNLFCTKFGAGFMFLLIHPASGPSFNIVSLLLRQPRKLCFCTCKSPGDSPGGSCGTSVVYSNGERSASRPRIIWNFPL